MENKTNQNNISNNIPKDANKSLQREERKELYKKCKQGKAKHKQYESLSKNLKPLNTLPKEEAQAIRRKGWQKMMELKGERKNAKQILDELLPLYANNNVINSNETIPQDIKELITKKNIKITQYDLIMLSQIYQAQNGNYKSAEFIRDTYGDKPINETHNVNESISEADKQLINNLKDRLNIIDIDENTSHN